MDKVLIIDILVCICKVDVFVMKEEDNVILEILYECISVKIYG